MRGLACALHTVFGLGLVLLVAWAMPLQAQNPPIEGTWSVVARTVKPAGQQVDIGMEARNRLLNSQTLYASERAALTPSTVGKLATGVLRRANGAYGTYVILKGVMDAAGWGINELRNQIVVPEKPRTNIEAGELNWCLLWPTGGQRCTVTGEGAISICNASLVHHPGAGYTHCTLENWEGTGNRTLRVWEGENNTTRRIFYARTWPEAVPDYGTGNPESNVTDEQIFELLRSTRPDLFAELLKDENGNVIVTPEVADALNRFRAAVEAATGATIDPIVSNPGAVEEGEGDATPSSWPKFCSWASVVCELAEWMKREPELDTPEVPIEEAPFELVQWTSGLGGGTCPAPVSTTVTMGSSASDVEFSYQPLCDLAVYVSPVVISMGLLIMVYIVAGVRSGGSA